MTRDLAQLQMLSALKFRHSEQAMSAILSRELALRAELARLRTLTHETQSQPPEQAELRGIGGDVIWLQWLEKEQRRLNVELAQVLAQKEGLMQQHVRAHGRKIVSETLLEDDAKMRQQKKRDTQLANAIKLSLMKRV